VEQERQLQLWRRAERLPRSAVALVLPVALVLMAGWVFQGRDLLSSTFQWVPALVPLTATCLVLTAAAMAWLLGGPHSRRLWAGLCAALVAAAGLLTLTAYALGRVRPWLLDFLSGKPMAPQTALCFTLLGLSLLSVDRGRRGAARSQLLALAALLVPLTVLLGYTFAEQRIYRLGDGIGTAPHTAVLQLLLCLGALFLRPDQGPAAVVAAAVVMVAAAVLTTQAWRR